MKRFIVGLILALAPAAALVNWGHTSRRLRKFGIAIVLGILMVIVCFEIAVALQLISGRQVLPQVTILAGSLLSFLFLVCLKTFPGSKRPPPPHKIDIAALLGRKAVALEAPEAHTALKGKVILVTGAAGSIGSELCQQLLQYEPALLIALDNNETGLFNLIEDLRSHAYKERLRPCISDITDMQSMTRLFMEKQPHVVFHAAAYKHVPLLEYFPDQAIRTNVLATYHLCCLARQHGVSRFVFISTDKAAQPTGIMGASKRLGEMIVQSFATPAPAGACFCAVRFGNVIGSRGSIVPLIAQQIERGGPVTVTDPQATRYFMTIPEACGLVILTAAIADQGGLYLLDMGKPVRIADLAIKLIRLHALREGKDIPIVYTGLRPGEHLNEILVGENEELFPTSHHKIFCINHLNHVPALATLAPCMGNLEHALQHESSQRLSERLFEVVRTHELIVTS